ncbi:MAG: SIS domain-containing protein, partial [Planctomycetaceae bacterium]
EITATIVGRLTARASRVAGIDPRFAGEIARAGLEVGRVLAGGGTVFAAGNGGSATQCQHLTSELVGRFRNDRPGLRAVSLTAESATLTAIANDYGFEQVFSRQVEALGSGGDLLAVFSTSGNSPNVIAAAHMAQERGLSVIGVSVAGGGQLAACCDFLVGAPSGSTAAIQEDHLTVIHLICEVVESVIFGLEYGPREVVGLVGLDVAVEHREIWRSEGRTVAWTSGCFDLLHAGHLGVIEAASAEADVLIVGVNSDDSVRRLKGPERPIVPQAERAALIGALRSVDLVVVFDEDDPSRCVELLTPEVYCKGGDYASGARPLPEREIVESYGGRLVFFPLVDGVSTTGRVARHRTDG